MHNLPDDDEHRKNFTELDHADQVRAIKRMAGDGHTDHTIAAATNLSVEFVRECLGLRDD